MGGAPIIASHLDQLPDQASILTEILRDSGVCSLAAFPLQRKGDTFAILAFSTIRHEREWPPDVVEALQTVAHIFANTLERVQAEKVLTESQNQLTGIVESAMDAIIAIDGQQRVVVFNPAAEKIFGCTAEKAIGQSIEHFIPHRFRTQHAKNISGFAETGVTNRSMGALGALSALRDNGEEFSIEASISQVWREGSRFFTVVIRDITESVRAEEQLRKSNQLNASILESLRNHVAVLDPKGIIVAATKRDPGFVPVKPALTYWIFVSAKLFRIMPSRSGGGRQRCGRRAGCSSGDLRQKTGPFRIGVRVQVGNRPALGIVVNDFPKSRLWRNRYLPSRHHGTKAAPTGHPRSERPLDHRPGAGAVPYRTRVARRHKSASCHIGYRGTATRKALS